MAGKRGWKNDSECRRIKESGSNQFRISHQPSYDDDAGVFQSALPGIFCDESAAHRIWRLRAGHISTDRNGAG